MMPEPAIQPLGVFEDDRQPIAHISDPRGMISDAVSYLATVNRLILVFSGLPMLTL